MTKSQLVDVQMPPGIYTEVPKEDVVCDLIRRSDCETDNDKWAKSWP